MEPDTYRHMAAVEADHWWFRGRRRIVAAAMRRYCLSSRTTPRILEIGCGVGGNLAMLSEFGPVHAVEPDIWAAEKAREKGIGQVFKGGLPSDMPDALNGAYDVVAMLDVLEHIDPAPEALRAAGARLAPDGRLLLTVPAYPWMFGDHDRRHHHYRRYTRTALASTLRDAGFEPVFMGHFNLLLLPPAVLVRLVQKWPGWWHGDDESRGASGFANTILDAIFALETPVAPRLPLPAGLSILAVAKAG